MTADEFFARLMPGFKIEAIQQEGENLTLEAQAVQTSSPCPVCHTPSSRVHSYYMRCPQDQPLGGQAVILRLHVRRFRCLNAGCSQQTFAERFPLFLSVYARRTDRLSEMLYHLGQLLGGIAAYRLAKRLKVTSSTDTFLRLIRRFAAMPNQVVRVLGVDDWAICKRTNYGTILVDLGRHQVVDLLPGRTAVVLAGWLAQRSGIEFVARDRSTEYARGITAGAPQAMQVADRWHLLQNLSNLLEKWLNRIYHRLKQIAIPPILLARSPFPQTESVEAASRASRSRRQECYRDVQRRRQEG